MDKFFSAFGKVVLILVILAVLVGGGIYIGLKFNKPSPATQTASPIQTTTPAQNSLNQDKTQPSVAPSASQTVSAGGFGSFPKYTINVPQGWQQEKTVNNFQDLLTISKNQY